MAGGACIKCGGPIRSNSKTGVCTRNKVCKRESHRLDEENKRRQRGIVPDTSCVACGKPFKRGPWGTDKHCGFCGKRKCEGCGEVKPNTMFNRIGHRNNSPFSPWCLDCEGDSCTESTRYRSRRYGISPKQYADLVTSQNGRCALCGEFPGGAGRLCIDHDHRCCTSRYRTCGKCVRGLLCVNCNVHKLPVVDSCIDHGMTMKSLEVYFPEEVAYIKRYQRMRNSD